MDSAWRIIRQTKDRRCKNGSAVIVGDAWVLDTAHNDQVSKYSGQEFIRTIN